MTAQRLALIGALIADPNRAGILLALMDGRAHTGSELARRLGVAPSTMSEHLARLMEGGMVVSESTGRHRYFRLANDETAQLLEALGANPSSECLSRVPAALALARTCYDHLAGEVAVTIYDNLIARQMLVPTGRLLGLTASGFELFEAMEVDVEAIRDSARPPCRACLDWSERRHHLAGAAGKELLAAFLRNGWVVRGERSRSVVLTDAGKLALRKHFQLSVA